MPTGSHPESEEVCCFISRPVIITDFAIMRNGMLILQWPISVYLTNWVVLTWAHSNAKNRVFFGL